MKEIEELLYDTVAMDVLKSFRVKEACRYKGFSFPELLSRNEQYSEYQIKDSIEKLIELELLENFNGQYAPHEWILKSLDDMFMLDKFYQPNYISLPDRIDAVIAQNTVKKILGDDIMKPLEEIKEISQGSMIEVTLKYGIILNKNDDIYDHKLSCRIMEPNMIKVGFQIESKQYGELSFDLSAIV